MKLSNILRKAGDRLFWWCPGCDEAHMIVLGQWQWNGNVDLPTFTPSVKLTGVRVTPEGRRMMDEGIHPPDGVYPSVPMCCHVVITNGRIQFCGDCTHSLVGQTVPMPEWPHWDTTLDNEA